MLQTQENLNDQDKVREIEVTVEANSIVNYRENINNGNQDVNFELEINDIQNNKFVEIKKK